MRSTAFIALPALLLTAIVAVQGVQPAEAGGVVGDRSAVQYEFESVGFLQLDATGLCVIFQAGILPLILEDYGSFEVGEFVYVKGYFEGCMSFCSIVGCLADNCISRFPEECAFCPWDLDDDGEVGITDFLDLLDDWGTDPFGAPDFDGDGDVGVTDFLDLLVYWGPCPQI